MLSVGSDCLDSHECLGGVISTIDNLICLGTANALVTEAELMLQKALEEKGPDTPVAFPNTAYYLPTIFGMTGVSVETLGQLQPALRHARELLHPVPSITTIPSLGF